MAGVTWRQHRFALAGVAVLLGGLAVYEWLTGESLHRAWAVAVACHPVGAPACQGPVNAFNYMENFVSFGGPLQLVPALIGAFTGAPVLAREMETGTLLSPFYTGLFDLRGLAFPAWTLAAFAIGALAGMLIRRVVPAIVATLAVYAGLAFAAARLLRWRYLARHGYTQWTSYQPASRLWAFQWIEAGWLLALSALLIAVTIWLVRRRAA